MFNERFAIQMRMQEIKEERRALHDEYYELLDRLRQIDTDSAQSEGFTADYAKLTEELTKAVQAVANLVPHVSPAQVVEHIRKEVPEVETMAKGEDEPQPTEVQQRIKKEVRRASIAIEASETALKMIKPKQAEPIVVNILKEEGIPLAPNAVRELLEAKGYTTKTSIHEILRRLSLSGKIESPAYGFWQVPTRSEVAASLQ
jgi:hypothetical protein